MALPHVSLSWDAHKSNIYSGLSSLQQNGEFVDMTLAADGHLVKVHQLVMALSSPYIKELIASADCPRPVIFLNKISYKTLCAILEYIYTGEVLVPVDLLNEVVEAGKELCIKGLENMEPQYISENQNTMIPMKALSQDSTSRTLQLKTTKPKQETPLPDESMDDTFRDDDYSGDENETFLVPVTEEKPRQDSSTKAYKDTSTKSKTSNAAMQYTLSNQGNIQMILNRYMYYLAYSSRNKTHRQWRCVNHREKSAALRCPASLISKDDVVVKRHCAHNHPFHDAKILKKVQAGAVFSALQEAEQKIKEKKETPAVHDKPEKSKQNSTEKESSIKNTSSYKAPNISLPVLTDSD